MCNTINIINSDVCYTRKLLWESILRALITREKRLFFNFISVWEDGCSLTYCDGCSLTYFIGYVSHIIVLYP